MSLELSRRSFARPRPGRQNGSARTRPRAPAPPPRQTGPTAWITPRAGSRPAVVAFASPVGQPPRRLDSARISGPPARWIAPSTPPPPSSDSFAAFTTASTACSVKSPTTNSIATAGPYDPPRGVGASDRPGARGARGLCGRSSLLRAGEAAGVAGARPALGRDPADPGGQGH